MEVINDDGREDNKESNIQGQIKTAQNFIKSGKEKQKENRDKVQTKIFLTLSIPGYFCLIMPQGGGSSKINLVAARKRFSRSFSAFENQDNIQIEYIWVNMPMFLKNSIKRW